MTAAAVPETLIERATVEPQRAFPAIAKDPPACAQLGQVVRGLPTRHVLYNLDSRQIDLKPEKSTSHLVSRAVGRFM